jgi:hypothetical protein
MTDAKEPLVRYGYRLTVRDDSAHRDAERAVIEAAKVAEMTLTSMAHAEAMYGGQLADQVLDLLDAIKKLRALEGDA